MKDLVVEYYELFKSTSDLSNVPLTLECVRTLSWSISFFPTSIVFLIVFCIRLLSELMILLSTPHLTNHLKCRDKSRWNLNCNLIFDAIQDGGDKKALTTSFSPVTSTNVEIRQLGSKTFWLLVLILSTDWCKIPKIKRVYKDSIKT